MTWKPVFRTRRSRKFDVIQPANDECACGKQAHMVLNDAGEMTCFRCFCELQTRAIQGWPEDLVGGF